MPDTTKTPPLDFVIDSSRDRYYRLLISDHPDTLPFIHDIPLENINDVAVRKLSDPATPHTVLESLLIPTNGAETVSVVVGTTVVGTLPDPSVVSDSQIARVYASGLIPTCKLVLTPAEQPRAHISLYKSDGGVPFNDPPAKPWTLLPGGSMWRVEPTRHSPFRDIQDESRVLVELRAIDEIIFVYLGGKECGILDIDAAEALQGAVQAAVRDGFIPVVRGCVERRDDDTISLHINALAFPLWSRENSRLRHNPMQRLLPYQRDPGFYRAELLQFIRCHERVPGPTPARNHPVVAGLRRYAPLAVILLAITGLILTVSGDLSARGVVGMLGINVVFAVLGLWILGCRQYDTTMRKQPRRWEITLPLGLSVLIPSVTFASVGIFHDTDRSLNSAVSAQSTTLLPFPHPQDLLSTLAEGQPVHPTGGVDTRLPGDTDSRPNGDPTGLDPQSPQNIQPDERGVPISDSLATPALTPSAEERTVSGEPYLRSPDTSVPLIWAEGTENGLPDSTRPLRPDPDNNAPPVITAPTPPVPSVPRNPVLPDTVTITPPVPGTPPPPNLVFLPGPIKVPDHEVPVWPEEPPTVDPPPTPTPQDPLDIQDVQDPRNQQGITPVIPPSIPTTPTTSATTPVDSPAEPAGTEGTTVTPSTGEQPPPVETATTQP